jgi:FixJ family two-component response regulator
MHLLKQFLDQQPDETAKSCILLDVRMPGLRGPELQSRLTELGWTLPILILTGHPDINVAVKAGAENFLVKPVSSNQWGNRVKKSVTNGRSAESVELL